MPYFLSTFFLFLLLTSCQLNPGSSGKPNKLYETFYVGEQGSQFFVKPLSCTSKQGDALSFDISFRYKNQLKDSATINFSLLSAKVEKQAKSLTIKSKSTSLAVQNIQLLFFEKNNKLYELRCSGKIALADLKKLFETQTWQFELSTEASSYSFTAANSLQKKLKMLNENVFVIL